MSLQLSDRPRYTALVYFFGQYKLTYLGILVLVLISALLESVSVAAFFPVFTSLLGNPDGGTGNLLGIMTEVTGRIPIADPIIAASVLLVCVFLSKALFGFIRDLLIGWAGAKVLYNVRQQVMVRHANASYEYHLENKQGSLLFNHIEAPNAVGILLFSGAQMLVAILKILAIILMLFTIFPLAALALCSLGLLYYAFVHLLSRKISYNLSRAQAQSGAAHIAVLNEFLSGFRQIVAFGATGWWVDTFDKINVTLRDLNIREIAWTAVPRPVMEIFGILLLLGLILTLGAFGGSPITEILPTLGVFAVALLQLMSPLGTIGALRIELVAALPRAELAHYSITGPIPMRKDGHLILKSFEDKILFSNVSFAHRNRDNLFNQIDIAFEKGKVTAIVGPSGVGKTTIVNLLLRIFEPTRGQITVDDIPLKDLTSNSWLGKIGFVSQDSFIYNNTVMTNILFGRDYHSNENVVKAAQIANAHEFIKEMPLGYDTIVGDRGMMLSGGQQQRLAIARAMLDDPEILIFDEATSSLDTISERLVQVAIENVTVDRTVIIVAHRLSTIRNADKIVVIDNGRVMEEGSHEYLIELNGHYASLTAHNL